MFFAAPVRKRALIKIALSIAIFLSLLFPIALGAATSDWNKLSDEQIARMFFPDEKLYFQPTLEGLPMSDPASLDGVNVQGVKRVIANFDNDPEEEMAVLIVYSTGMCTSCVDNVIFAILDKQNGKVRIAWRSERGFAGDGTDISKVKLIKKDKFFELSCTYDTTPGITGSAKEIKIIRWDGKKFSTIWGYELERHFSGTHESLPHDYSAKVDFVDAKKAKRIKVSATFTYQGGSEKVVWKEYKLNEEFVWREKDQEYVRVLKLKRIPLTPLNVYRAAELPRFEEFPFSVIRDLASRGTAGSRGDEVLMTTEVHDRQGNPQFLFSVLRIDLQNATVSIQRTLPPSANYQDISCQFGLSAQKLSCEVHVKMKGYSRSVSVDFHGWSPAWSPMVRTIDYKEGGLPENEETSLLDHKAFVIINKAQVFTLPKSEMPGIVVFGTRVRNPILKELNEYGLFLYVWEGQKYVLKGKYSFPKGLNVGDIEAFTLLPWGMTKGYRPAGILALKEGSYGKALYIFK